MTSILISINKPHVDNIRAGLKSEEMRKSAPSLYTKEAAAPLLRKPARPS